MLNSDIDTRDTRIYAIAYDLAYQLVATVEEALQLQPRPLLVVTKSNTGSTQSYFDEYHFVHSAYQLLRPGTADSFYEEQGWRLLQVAEPQGRSHNTCFTLADPIGGVKTLWNTKLKPNDWSIFFQLPGICNILRLLRFLAPYQSWEHFETAQGDALTALKKVDLSAPTYNAELLKAKQRVHLWKLSNFLLATHTYMSYGELHSHLVRNQLTGMLAPEELPIERMPSLIQDTQEWVAATIGEPAEVMKLTRAFRS